ncbi:YDG domain-containing protein [Bradyrhizobium sp. 2TAF24]|uniref:YDG domain-containing protein n=1 Tax=Bradyrhizobium sp. 2TAF24 TaxID=3233011 RepID=UPI003F8DB2FC
MRAALLLATTELVSPVLFGTASAQSLPTGGAVAAGTVAIGQPSANQLTVTQSSQSAVVNWQGFSVGTGNAVNFVQPNSSSAILNRVTGATPSTIAGAINANGQVYLVNPNGIAITNSGTVNTGGGFVASTLGISDSDFMAGKRSFTGSGASAAVSNAGTITVGHGGYAALIGGTVSNSGLISVPLGRAALGSGEQAALDFSGDGFLQVAVPTATGGKGALVRNSGTIAADGGSVILSAATAREAARNAINISGVVQARSIGGRSGSIIIGGGEGGVVKISGRLATTSQRHSGGAITVTGQSIRLKHATIDASGATGGGTVRIGGDMHGAGPLPQAQSVTMDAATTIRADATQAGDGGQVTLWSTGTTRVFGLISAMGGPGGGHGGTVETSGHVVDFTGIRVNTSAPAGATGLWLVDPIDLTIDGAAAATINSNLASSNVMLQTTATTASGPGSQTSGLGDIYVNAPISWSTANTLTLSAYNSINIVSSITASGNGGLILTTSNHVGGANAAGALNFYGGNVQLLGNSAALTINGTSYTLIRTVAQLVAVNGNLSGNYALAKSLDLGGTTYTDGVIAGAAAGAGFTGTFNGLGNTISNLTINSTGSSVVGLFGTVGNGSTNNSAGTVANLGLIGGSVTGSAPGATVGALAGTNTGTIINAYATTAVTGGAGAMVGGLVGYNWGAISNAHAGGTVIDTMTGTWVGGLVGYNDGYTGGGGTGTITNAYATGMVSGGGGTGGIGTGSGAGSDTGGLVGINQGTITNAYATGAVSAGAGSYFGGLVGENNFSGGVGTVSYGYWDSTTSGISAVGHGAGTAMTTAALQNGSLPSGFGSAWSAMSGRYPILGPAVLTINFLSQTATYGTAYSLQQTSAAYTETLNGVALTGGSFINLTGLSLIAAGTGSVSGTTASTNAGSYTISGTGASASGFIISYGTTPATLTVNPLAVTLTGTQAYNGSTSIAAGSLTVSNRVGSDTVGLSGSASVASANVSAGAQTLNLAGLSLSNSNYTLTGASGTATITPLAVTLTGSKVYDGTATVTTAGLTASNKVGADNIGLTGTATVASANVSAGTQTLNLAGLSLSNTNYTLSGASGSFTINPLAVTLSGSKVYDGGTSVAAGGLTLANGIGGATATSIGLSGSGAVASANVSAGAQTLATTGFAVTDSNYTVTGGSGTVTITPLAVTLTGSRSYDGTTTVTAASLAASNKVGTDNIGLTGSGAVASANVSAGTQTLNLAGLSLGNTNYTLSGASGSFTIHPLAVTLTGSKVYDGGTSVAASGLTLTNGVAGATATSIGLSGSGSLASANVSAGAQTLATTGFSVTDSNYTVTGGSGTVSITPLAVTLTGSRSYDGTTTVTASSLTVSNRIGTDNIGLTGSGAVTSANVSAGTQTLNLAGLSLGNTNYTLSGASGSFTIHPLAVTLTGSKVYDGGTAFAASGLTLTNGVAGATATSIGLSGSGAVASANVSAGAQTLITTGLSVTDGNYTVTGGSGTVSITPLAVTLTGSRSYDGTATVTASSLTASNRIGTDNIGLSGSGAVASANVSAGTQTLNLAGLSLSNTNYTLSGASGSFTINPLAVTLTGSKIYDGGTAFAASGLTLTNGVAGATATSIGLSGSGSVASANVSAGAQTLITTSLSVTDSNFTVTGGSGTASITPLAVTLAGSRSYDGTTAVAASSLSASNRIGSDNIGLSGSASVTSANVSAGTQTLNLAGLSLGNTNYTLSGASGSFTINPLAVTLTGSKVYDGGTAVAANGLTLTNGVAGATAASIGLGGTGSVASANVSAGTQALNLAGLSLGNTNYTLSGASGSFTINPLAVTLTGSKVYDGRTAVAASGLTLTNGLAGATAASIGLSGAGSVASPNVSAGLQALNTAGLSVADSNYTVVGGTGTARVLPAPVVVTALGGTSVFGTSPANPGLSASGLQNGESIAVLTGLTNSFDINSTSSVAGSPYVLNVVGVSSNPNYTIVARNAGLWTVTAPTNSDASTLASTFVRETFDIAAAGGGRPEPATVDVVSSGTGVVFEDRRFDHVVVCFPGAGTCGVVNPRQP